MKYKTEDTCDEESNADQQQSTATTGSNGLLRLPSLPVNRVTFAPNNALQLRTERITCGKERSKETVCIRRNSSIQTFDLGINLVPIGTYNTLVGTAELRRQHIVSGMRHLTKKQSATVPVKMLTTMSKSLLPKISSGQKALQLWSAAHPYRSHGGIQDRSEAKDYFDLGTGSKDRSKSLQGCGSTNTSPSTISTTSMDTLLTPMSVSTAITDSSISSRNTSVSSGTAHPTDKQRRQFMKEFGRRALLIALHDGIISLEVVEAIPIDWQSLAMDYFRGKKIVDLSTEEHTVPAANPLLCQKSKQRQILACKVPARVNGAATVLTFNEEDYSLTERHTTKHASKEQQKQHTTALYAEQIDIDELLEASAFAL